VSNAVTQSSTSVASRRPFSAGLAIFALTGGLTLLSKGTDHSVSTLDGCPQAVSQESHRTRNKNKQTRPTTHTSKSPLESAGRLFSVCVHAFFDDSWEVCTRRLSRTSLFCLPGFVCLLIRCAVIARVRPVLFVNKRSKQVTRAPS
jgi:hypothetical protein